MSVVNLIDYNTFDYALFFESAIDLMSFMDYKLNQEKKSLDKCILISMSGLKVNIVKHMLKSFKGNMKVTVCVDNDKAGQMFKNELEKEQISYIDKTPDKKYKDWNEQLVDEKRYTKPIARLMNRKPETDKDISPQPQQQAEPQKDL